MVITSDKNYLGGQPRINDCEYPISYIIVHINENDLIDCMYDFNLNEDNIEEAIKYCMNEECVGNTIKYCNYCYKGKYGIKLWKIAKKLHKKYFNDKSTK